MYYADGTYRLLDTSRPITGDIELVDFYEDGYWVAVTHNKLYLTDSMSIRMFDSYVDTAIRAVAIEGLGSAEPTGFAGVWSSGPRVVCVDVAHHVKSRETAIIFGQSTNQYSIWDIAKGEEIVL